MEIAPDTQGRVGTIQYRDTLPLADKEVVLTFDDGPSPAHTAQVLRALDDECVKATFFVVGSMVRAHPEWVRRTYNAGHTIATHSDRHPGRFDLLGLEGGAEEVERGIAAAEAALGDRRALAPFFRFPGLRRSDPMEAYLANRGMMAWSADVPGDDWKPITADAVIERTMARLEKKGRGIILLHDIQARTALALPGLLRELKAHGYRVVHVVPATAGRPLTVPEPPPSLVARAGRRPIWPVARVNAPAGPPELAVPSALSFGFPDVFAREIDIGGVNDDALPVRIARAALPMPSARTRRTAAVRWPRPVWKTPAETASADLPVPSHASLDLRQPLASHLATRFAEQVRPRPSARKPTPAVRTARRQPKPELPAGESAAGEGAAAKVARGEVRLRGRIDEDGPRQWSRQLNWFQ